MQIGVVYEVPLVWIDRGKVSEHRGKDLAVSSNARPIWPIRAELDRCLAAYAGGSPGKGMTTSADKYRTLAATRAAALAERKGNGRIGRMASRVHTSTGWQGRVMAPLFLEEGPTAVEAFRPGS